MELKGAVAVVTGGASGIGEAVAKGMAAKGVKVVIGDMDPKGMERVVSEIVAAGGEAVYLKCNVTQEDQVADLMDLAISQFGQLNIAVASAGIIKDGLMINTDKDTGKVKRAMTTEQFKAVIDVNLVGAFITVREAAIRMANGGWPSLIVPISSVNKAGQVGQNIRVVAVAPGYVGTPMVKGMNQEALSGILKGVHIGRLIEPSEIADIISYAAQNEAIDATCLEITGGLISTGLAR
jgi:3-oxoacyl-[acyl-carrier protein] reductase